MSEPLGVTAWQQATLCDTPEEAADQRAMDDMHFTKWRERCERAEADLAEHKAMLHDAKVRLDTQTDMTAKADESAERWYDRALRLEADLADEKRRRAELRAGVEALAAEYGCSCLLDYRPCVGCRARALLDTATEETLL